MSFPNLVMPQPLPVVQPLIFINSPGGTNNFYGPSVQHMTETSSSSTEESVSDEEYQMFQSLCRQIIGLDFPTKEHQEDSKQPASATTSTSSTSYSGLNPEQWIKTIKFKAEDFSGGLVHQASAKAFDVRTETINLSGNSLTTLPSSIVKCSRLRILDLSNNSFTSVPEEIFLCKNITYLNLSNNALKELPAKIFLLPNLQFLLVSKNQLQSLPKEIGCNKTLRILDLSRNQIEVLPQEMERLQRLEKINLRDNKISETPSFIYKLPKLFWLCFAENHLKSIPQKLVYQHTFTWLDLRRNPIKSFPKVPDGVTFVFGSQSQRISPQLFQGISASTKRIIAIDDEIKDQLTSEKGKLR